MSHARSRLGFCPTVRKTATRDKSAHCRARAQHWQQADFCDYRQAWRERALLCRLTILHATVHAPSPLFCPLHSPLPLYVSFSFSLSFQFLPHAIRSPPTYIVILLLFPLLFFFLSLTLSLSVSFAAFVTHSLSSPSISLPVFLSFFLSPSCSILLFLSSSSLYVVVFHLQRCRVYHRRSSLRIIRATPESSHIASHRGFTRWEVCTLIVITLLTDSSKVISSTMLYQSRINANVLTSHVKRTAS